jgi:hypothetical protein
VAIREMVGLAVAIVGLVARLFVSARAGLYVRRRWG